MCMSEDVEQQTWDICGAVGRSPQWDERSSKADGFSLQMNDMDWAIEKEKSTHEEDRNN